MTRASEAPMTAMRSRHPTDPRYFLIGMSDRLGTIETGKLVDLLVVRDNPLEDIRNTRKVQLVMGGGVVYDPAALLKSVEGKLGPAGPEDAGNW